LAFWGLTPYQRLRSPPLGQNTVELVWQKARCTHKIVRPKGYGSLAGFLWEGIPMKFF